MRILLVEDDAVLRDVMLRSLADAGHRVDVSTNIEDADHLWRVQPFDAVLLDLNLPATASPTSGLASGLNALRQARARGDRTPVLVLTARGRTEERIAGLDAGADDYLGKPFDLAEVEARLRALVRRAKGTEDIVLLGQLKLDRKARRFSTASGPLDLPAREFEVLWELMSPPGRTVSKRALSDKLSSFDESLGDNALEAFISRLRKKLAGSGAGIRTLRGIGYLLEAEVVSRTQPAAPGPSKAAPSLTRRVLRNVLVPLALTWMVGAVIALVIANYFSEQAFDRAMLDDAYALSANVQAGERGIELLLTPREVATVLFDQVDKIYFAVQRLDGTLISGTAGPDCAAAHGRCALPLLGRQLRWQGPARGGARAGCRGGHSDALPGGDCPDHAEPRGAGAAAARLCAGAAGAAAGSARGMALAWHSQRPASARRTPAGAGPARCTTSPRSRWCAPRARCSAWAMPSMRCSTG